MRKWKRGGGEHILKATMHFEAAATVSIISYGMLMMENKSISSVSNDGKRSPRSRSQSAFIPRTAEREK